MVDYDGIRALAKTMRTPVTDFLALASINDPFYADVAFRKLAAEWFVSLKDRIDFGHRFHIRRAHYKIISQATPIRKPNGDNYENTDRDWNYLLQASRDARYLGLIDPGSVIDNRNPEAEIYARFEADTEPEICSIFTTLYQIELPESLRVPELMLSGFNAQQRYIIEIWTEKSGQNDILRPIARDYRVNLINFDGECSEAGCRDAIRRAIGSDRPLRILYLSDFDPAGRSMPVASARKIEYWLRHNHPDLDVTVDPLALLPEQAERYELPRTPIKEGERRGKKFEDRFGRGATEIDALEALHPGELRKIVTAGIARHYDPTLSHREWEAMREIEAEISQVENEVHDRHQDQIDAVQIEYQQLRQELIDLRERSGALWQEIANELEHNAPAVRADDVPEAREEKDQLCPLFDSKRDYLAQLDFYRHWQGKAAP